MAVAVVALIVWRRRRLGFERLIGLGLLALAAGVYASGLLADLPDPEKVIEDVAEALGQWTYLLVGALAFLETGAFVGLVAPGEFTVILGGVIAGQGEISILLLVGIVWASAVAGDTVSFFIGRRLGRSFLEKHGPRVKITAERLAQVEGYFDRHGGKTILIGRFIGLVRALAPFVAGSSRMPYSRFIPFSIVGTGLWATTFCLLGYFFYRSFEQVANIAGRATVGFGIVVAVVVGVVWTYRRLKEEENRRKVEAWFERQGRRPLLRPVTFVIRPLWRRLLRPLWRFLAPQLRFLWGRLTPGGLGLELTTALAVGGAGLYVFTLYAVTLADDPGLTPFDQDVLDFARDIRLDELVDVAKVVTEIGSLPVVAAAALVGAALLAWRRRPVEIVVLVGGLIALYLAVQISKSGIDRPRPPMPITDTSTPSYPSGHAAYSTAYVAMAVIAARGIVSRAAFLLAALAVAATVGATRVYLEVHYWSDVAGGWALGAAAFGIFGVFALLVSYIRQNPAPPPDERQPAPAATERAG